MFSTKRDYFFTYNFRHTHY